MLKRTRKTLALLLVLTLVVGISAQAIASAPTVGSYAYDRINDKDFVSNTGITERTETNNGSRKISVARAQGVAQFAESVTVDGVREAAWDAAEAYVIDNGFNATITTAVASPVATGTVRYLWDGPVLYLLIEVTGDANAATANQAWNSSSLASTANTDGVVVGFDVFNDQWGMETDTQTWLFVNQNATTFLVGGGSGANIPALNSFLNTTNFNYSPRVKAVKSSAYNAATNAPGVNYTYEIALQIEGTQDVYDYELKNGTKIGIEVGIQNGTTGWAFWSKVNAADAREGSSNLPNNERTRNRDWGEVTLGGWDEEAPFAYSTFTADEAIRWWNSPNNPGAGGNYTVTTTGNGSNSNVWRADTKTRMVAAVAAWNAIKNSAEATREEKEAAILEVNEAFYGLRWVDETFPDPKDLPSLQTIPDPYLFFDSTKDLDGDGYVTTPAEWEVRKEEILALAEFYEYGYKPKLGEDYNIVINSVTYTGSSNATISANIVPTNTGHWTGGTAINNKSVSITPPAATAAKAGFGFGATPTGTIGAGTLITNASDTRTDAYTWGTRSSNFYTLFPYNRNRAGTDVSYEMAYATAVSIQLDIIEAACAFGTTAANTLDSRIDVNKSVTAGFSISGKLAWVAAAWDKRVAVTIPGAAGATGPANWRYNVQGQEYNFTGTLFYNTAASANVVAHGTEGPGNSYRHNRVRETEMFRHFMPNGHMYIHEEGSYAYGRYSRLPFDNALVAATFAPDRMIILNNCLNDFNDGAGTDNMSFQLARAVYKALGVDPDKYVKFASANYANSGDPHGYTTGQVSTTNLAADFLNGTSLVTGANAVRALTDPFNLLVSNGQTQSAYDYYWGGFNTITGGVDGIDGTDGWYSYVLPADTAALVALIEEFEDLVAIDYTVASWGPALAAYLAASELLEGDLDINDQAAVDAAYATLLAAIAALIDRSDLAAAIAAGTVIELSGIAYVAAPWSVFTTAIAAARLVYGTDDATQAAIDDATEALLLAIEGLTEEEIATEPITLATPDKVTIKKGRTVKVPIEFNGNEKYLAYTSGNAAVATVAGSGTADLTVTGVKVGNAPITVRANDGSGLVKVFLAIVTA